MVWLFEGDSTVYLLLGIAVVVFAALWWVTGRRFLAIIAGVMASLIFLYALLDWLVVTDREQIVLHVSAMSKAVGDKNLDGIFRHVSDEFRIGQLDKARFRQVAEFALLNGDVTRLAPSAIEPQAISRADKTGQVHFQFKIEGNQSAGFYRCRAVFGLDPDGQWRLRSFRLFTPSLGARDESEVPVPSS